MVMEMICINEVRLNVEIVGHMCNRTVFTSLVLFKSSTSSIPSLKISEIYHTSEYIDGS
jgi:hypothetical protein